ncbi:MAG: ABC transporter ATP-binding protein [Gammaproteobacteria bacterium]|nr:MAG: ABC transporter ATP-binding protein [Gammaproteobacteria bacterium]RLA61701.1 MAG: ABC transporter ATP-binding protein [Gammaproteobacteria bacterium]
MLKIEHLTKSFGGVVATNDVSLHFQPASLSAIIGPNGAGKTTFFNLITGGLRPDSGRIIFDGEDITGFDALTTVRRGIGRAFQVANLFPEFTVRESLTAAVLSHRQQSAHLLVQFSAVEARTRADQIMEMFDLQERAGVVSRNLSHGDQKLLDIALALALDPRVLLLDEPTAGMGPEERWKMIDMIYKLWEDERMTLIFIEHDMDIVFRIAQTVRVLCYGQVLAEGAPEEIRSNPDVIKAYLGENFEKIAQ